MLRIRRMVLNALVATALYGAGGAHAGEVSSGFYGNHTEFRHHGNARASVAGGDGLPSYVRGIGTFSGGLSAVRFKRNGIYFSADGGSFNRRYGDNGSTVRSRIIDVNQKTIGAECSYEAGVCVIRP